jgi:hypothetical protein
MGSGDPGEGRLDFRSLVVGRTAPLSATELVAAGYLPTALLAGERIEN